ncbi:MAG: RNA methyltransferase [Eubacterium sp.]|nr:RNA methyltransferase [Eubacterium sp.]
MKFEYIDIKTLKERSELELYFSTNENQLLHFFEPELGLFAVESPMVIERALMAGYEPRSFVMIDSVAEEMCRRFEEIIMSSSNNDRRIPVYIADYETIAGMTGVNITRGVLAIMKRRTLPEIRDIVDGCHRIAVFDDVENPTNVGAMFRSAAALGIDAVILTGSSSDPLYRRASRVSVGTVFQMPWTKITKKTPGKMTGQKTAPDKAVYVKLLQGLGFRTVAMALTDNSISIDDECLKKEDKLAIIMGNEGFGLADEVIASSDYVAKIPMKEGVDSLNVAAASSVIFWELSK